MSDIFKTDEIERALRSKSPMIVTAKEYDAEYWREKYSECNLNLLMSEMRASGLQVDLKCSQISFRFLAAVTGILFVILLVSVSIRSDTPTTQPAAEINVESK